MAWFEEDENIGSILGKSLLMGARAAIRPEWIRKEEAEDAARRLAEMKEAEAMSRLMTQLRSREAEAERQRTFEEEQSELDRAETMKRLMAQQSFGLMGLLKDLEPDAQMAVLNTLKPYAPQLYEGLTREAQVEVPGIPKPWEAEGGYAPEPETYKFREPKPIFKPPISEDLKSMLAAVDKSNIPNKTQLKHQMVREWLAYKRGQLQDPVTDIVAGPGGKYRYKRKVSGIDMKTDLGPVTEIKISAAGIFELDHSKKGREAITPIMLPVDPKKPETHEQRKKKLTTTIRSYFGNKDFDLLKNPTMTFTPTGYKALSSDKQEKLLGLWPHSKKVKGHLARMAIEDVKSIFDLAGFDVEVVVDKEWWDQPDVDVPPFGMTTFGDPTVTVKIVTYQDRWKAKSSEAGDTTKRLVFTGERKQSVAPPGAATPEQKLDSDVARIKALKPGQVFKYRGKVYRKTGDVGTLDVEEYKGKIIKDAE